MLIVLGWTSLFGAFPRVFGLTRFDFVVIAGICMVFAVALAARTWVKAHAAQRAARRAVEGAQAGEPAGSGRERVAELPPARPPGLARTRPPAP